MKGKRKRYEWIDLKAVAKCNGHTNLRTITKNSSWRAGEAMPIYIEWRFITEKASNSAWRL